MNKITTRIGRLGTAELRGGAKHWAKHVIRTDPSKHNGYAFIGDWVDVDRSVELPVGAVVLAFDGVNSKTEFHATIRVMQATERGMATIEEETTTDRGWAVKFRPSVEALLGTAGERFFRLVLTERQLEIVEGALEALVVSQGADDPEGEQENQLTLAAVRTGAEEVR